MGRMDVLPVISKGFIIFFPVVVILLALAAFFRLFNRSVYPTIRCAKTYSKMARTLSSWVRA
jgi:hypothetical protein